MAELRGTWLPQTEAEAEFIETVNAVSQQAYEDGVEQEDIVSGLNFLAATIAKHEADTDDVPMPEPPEKREDCPECGEGIASVRAFIGGECIVSPCGCSVESQLVEGWVMDDG